MYGCSLYHTGLQPWAAASSTAVSGRDPPHPSPRPACSPMHTSLQPVRPGCNPVHLRWPPPQCYPASATASTAPRSPPRKFRWIGLQPGQIGLQPGQIGLQPDAALVLRTCTRRLGSAAARQPTPQWLRELRDPPETSRRGATAPLGGLRPGRRWAAQSPLALGGCGAEGRPESPRRVQPAGLPTLCRPAGASLRRGVRQIAAAAARGRSRDTLPPLPL